MQQPRRIKDQIDYIQQYFQLVKNCGYDLVALGLAMKKGDDDVYIPTNQLAFIINFDETFLSIDSGSGQRGGCLEIIYVERKLPQAEEATSKSSLTMTMIIGSSVSGEALPLHFQFSTTAKSDETKQFCVDMAEFMSSVKRKFECKLEQLWGTTFGMNLKGGIDDEVFQKYIFNSFWSLFPDEPRLQVMIKVDN